jgi:hypothetical protein
VSEHRSADLFFVIDFDRCLSDTDRLDEVFYSVVEADLRLDSHHLKTLREEIESKGGSFDQITELQKILTPEELNSLFEAFITRGQEHDLLAYGAHEFLATLDEKHIPYGIVSFGHPDWQAVKIRASKLAALPALIIEHPHKGEVVKSWQQLDKTFNIPSELTVTSVGMNVDTVVLMDDKAGAFDQLPSEARGYWIQSLTRSLLPSQDGPIPKNVKIAHGFDEVRAFESL